jgi:hypothetical protein
MNHEQKVPRLKDVGSTATRITLPSLTQILHQPHTLQIQD